MDDATSDPTDTTPDEYLQGEAVTLLDVLEGFARDGFRGQFAEANGDVRCTTCGTVSPANAIELHELRRLEGASDPADMLAVAAIACPACGTRGTLVLTYGPEATAGDDEVLRHLS